MKSSSGGLYLNYGLYLYYSFYSAWKCIKTPDNVGVINKTCQIVDKLYILGACFDGH